jgi:hypothetical protein
LRGVGICAVAKRTASLFSIAANPLGCGLGRDGKGQRRSLLSVALLDDHPGHSPSIVDGQSCILARAHSILLGENLIARYYQLSRSDRMDSLLKIHS